MNISVFDARRELNEILTISQQLENRKIELINYINENVRIERNRLTSLREQQMREKRERKKQIKNKIIALKKVEIIRDMTDCCGICLNKHKKIESIICSCSHEFGKECFQEWTNSCNRNNKKVNCPTCRSDISGITSFRERNNTKKKLIQQNENNAAIA